MYKITIEIPEDSARFIRSMASFGRHFDQTMRLTSAIWEGETISEDMEQLGLYVELDTMAVKKALDPVMYQIRNQLVAQGVKPLWDQNQK